MVFILGENKSRGPAAPIWEDQCPSPTNAIPFSRRVPGRFRVGRSADCLPDVQRRGRDPRRRGMDALRGQRIGNCGRPQPQDRRSAEGQNLCSLYLGAVIRLPVSATMTRYRRHGSFMPPIHTQRAWPPTYKVFPRGARPTYVPFRSTTSKKRERQTRESHLTLTLVSGWASEATATATAC